MKRILLFVVVLIFLLVSCGGRQIQQREVPPVGCEDSLIYKYIPYPKAVDTVIKLAAYNVAEEVGGAKQDILSVVEKLEGTIRPIANGSGTMTGEEFVALVAQEVSKLNSKYVVNLLIISEDLQVLAVPSPLTQCDGEMILDSLSRISRWVSMARPKE